MTSPSTSARPMALIAFLALCACSTVADSSLDQGEAESYGGDGDGDGDGDAGEDPGAEDTGEAGDGDPDEESLPPASLLDPRLITGMCDPVQAQLISYDLRDAQLEAAPVLVSERVLAGDGVVPAVPLSPLPFFSHYEYDYAPATSWSPEISGELWRSSMVNIDAPPRYHLQYAVRGPAISPEERVNAGLAVDLAVVIDLGSGTSDEAFALAHEALAALDAALAPGDRVALIGAADSPALLGVVEVEGQGLAPLTGLVAEQGLELGAGPANLSGALGLAYGSISGSMDAGGPRQPRVLLLSNGHFDPHPLEGLVEDEAISGRYLVTLGLGDPALFDDGSVRALAHEGRGAMLFAVDSEQLWAELHQDFASNFLAAATELELHLTLPAGLALRQREADLPEALGEAKLALLAPNDALVLHHELEACGEIAEDAVIRVELEWTDPLAQTAGQASWEQPVAGLDASPGEGSLRGQKGAATVAYVRALRSFRDGQAATQDYGLVLDAISLVSAALASMPEDGDLIEMSSVLARLF